MLKGVNHQMIEVSRPDDPYFEKALLVVRPGADIGNEALHSQATKALLQAGTYSGLRRRRWRYRLTQTAWALLGGVFGLLLGLAIR